MRMFHVPTVNRADRHLSCTETNAFGHGVSGSDAEWDAGIYKHGDTWLIQTVQDYVPFSLPFFSGGQ